MKRFKDILCVVEIGEACKPALERAVTLADNNQASLTVINMIEGVNANIGITEATPIAADRQTAMAKALAQRLEALVDPYRKRIKIKTKVLQGTPFLEIIREVIRNGRDLVIKCPETQNWLDRLFGSNDMHLLRKCPCPVWLVKPDAPKSDRRILAAVDVDDAYPPAEIKTREALNRQTFEMASSLALSSFAELHIVYAWEAIGERAMSVSFVRTPQEQVIDYLEQSRRHHEGRMGAFIREVTGNTEEKARDRIKPVRHLVNGWARKEVPKLAKRIGADLVVMGTVARTSIPGFIMGNTAETILNQIDCSVIAVKPPGFVTPVTLKD